MAERTDGPDLLGSKLYFDQFVGLVGGGFPFPAANGYSCGLDQDGVSTFDIDGLDTAIGSDQDINFYDTLEREIAGQ